MSSEDQVRVPGVGWKPRRELTPDDQERITRGPNYGKPRPAVDLEALAWNGDFLVLYPNGEQSHFTNDGTVFRPGDDYGTRYVIDCWDNTDRPVEDGRYMLVAILREKEVGKVKLL